MNCSRKQRTVGGLPLRMKAQLSEVEQDLQHKGKCPQGGTNARTIDSKIDEEQKQITYRVSWQDQ